MINRNFYMANRNFCMASRNLYMTNRNYCYRANRNCYYMANSGCLASSNFTWPIGIVITWPIGIIGHMNESWSFSFFLSYLGYGLMSTRYRLLGGKEKKGTELFYRKILNTVKLVHVITSIKQPPVLKGHLFLVLSYFFLYELNLF